MQDDIDLWPDGVPYRDLVDLQAHRTHQEIRDMVSFANRQTGQLTRANLLWGKCRVECEFVKGYDFMAQRTMRLVAEINARCA